MLIAMRHSSLNLSTLSLSSIFLYNLFCLLIMFIICLDIHWGTLGLDATILLGTKFDMIFMIVLFRTSTWAFGLQLRHNSSCQGKSRTALSINSRSALPNCHICLFDSFTKLPYMSLRQWQYRFEIQLTENHLVFTSWVKRGPHTTVSN